MDIEDASAIRITNYKSIGIDGGGFDAILPINLIIGRNNSGKSTLIDLVDYLVRPSELSSASHQSPLPRVTFSLVPPTDKLRRVFSENASGGAIRENHWSFGQRLIGKPVTWELTPRGSIVFVASDSELNESKYGPYQEQLARETENPFAGFVFRRL